MALGDPNFDAVDFGLRWFAIAAVQAHSALQAVAIFQITGGPKQPVSQAKGVLRPEVTPPPPCVSYALVQAAVGRRRDHDNFVHNLITYKM